MKGEIRRLLVTLLCVACENCTGGATHNGIVLEFQLRVLWPAKCKEQKLFEAESLNLPRIHRLLWNTKFPRRVYKFPPKNELCLY
jgi:hypothetical protein